MLRVIAAVLASLALLAGCGEKPDPSPELAITPGEQAKDGTECDPLVLIREALAGRPWNSGYIDRDSALAVTTGDVELHVGCGPKPWSYDPEHWQAGH